MKLYYWLITNSWSLSFVNCGIIAPCWLALGYWQCEYLPCCFLLQRGFDPQWLSITFSKAIFLGNGLIAIVAGLFANLLADNLGFGPVAPFDAAACFLAIGMAIIMSSWSENYGDSSESKDLMAQFKVAAKAIASGMLNVSSDCKHNQICIELGIRILTLSINLQMKKLHYWEPYSHCLRAPCTLSSSSGLQHWAQMMKTFLMALYLLRSCCHLCWVAPLLHAC